MSKAVALIKQAFSNKIVYYIVSRYFTYFIQFVNSLFIAAFLGPYYLGVWGFINLVIQYFLQINFGIAHSFNALVSIHKQDETYVKKSFSTSVMLLLILSALAGSFFTINHFSGGFLGKQYGFGHYEWYICIIALLNYFITLCSNLFRVYNKLFEIAFSQSIFPVLTVFCLFMSKGVNLLNNLVLANLIAFALSLLLFILRAPVPLKPSFSAPMAGTIVRKGLFLFLYNTSFYLITISTRSFISAGYPVKDFGYFTFSYSMASVIQLLFESFSFLIFPKVINRLAKSDNQEAVSLLDKIRNDFITISYLCVFIAILVFPLLLHFFPAYKDSGYSFGLIVLTLVLYTNCFGYSSLLIARGREKQLGILAFLALALNVLIAFLLTRVFRVRYEFVILATTVAYFVYLMLITAMGRRTLLGKAALSDVFLTAFPLSFVLPYGLSIALFCLHSGGWLTLLPLVLFVVLNIRRLKNIFATIMNIIRNPNVINV